MKQLDIGLFIDGKWSEIFLKKCLKNKKFKIKFVVLRHNIKSNTLKLLADKKNIPIYQFKNVNDKKSINILKGIKCDIFCSLSYDQIFKSSIINQPQLGIVNCHAGMLPDYKGRNILNWAIINGEKETGVTTFLIFGLRMFFEDYRCGF